MHVSLDLPPSLPIDLTMPVALRRALYVWHELATLVPSVLRSPLQRESWGRLLGLPRFAVVDRGRIYRSGEPSFRQHADHLARLGVRTIVCVKLGGPSLATREIARDLGIELLTFDLGPDGGYDLSAVEGAVEAAMDAARQPTLVHCSGGRHRSGMVAALVGHALGRSRHVLIDEYRSLAQPSPLKENLRLLRRTMAPVQPREGSGAG